MDSTLAGITISVVRAPLERALFDGNNALRENQFTHYSETAQCRFRPQLQQA